MIVVAERCVGKIIYVSKFGCIASENAGMSNYK